MEQNGRRKHGGSKLVALLDKYKYALLVAAVGILLLVWPVKEAPEENVSEYQMQSISDEAAELEKEMEEILSAIHGVGEVKLMLTLDRGKEALLAEESSLSYSGDTRAPEDYQRTSQPLVLSGDDADDVVIRQEVYPTFRGALVVCQGGGDPAVQLSVIEAVSALTGLGADKISVVKWQE